MANRKQLLNAADYADAFEEDMPPKLRQLFGELKLATRELTRAARNYAIAEAEYFEAKEKAVKKGKKRNG